MIGLASDKQPTPVLFDVLNLSDAVVKQISELLSKDQVKVTYNWLEVGPLLTNAGFAIDGVMFDVLLASQLLKAGTPGKCPELGTLANSLLGMNDQSLNRNRNWYGPLVQAQYQLAAARVGVLLPLREKLISLLKKHDLIDVAKLEFECSPAMIEMSVTGIKVDADRLAKVSTGLKTRADEFRQKLQRWLPTDVNVDSPAQIKDALKKIGIEIESVGRDSLLALKDHEDLVHCILGYREAVTMERNVVRKTLASVDANTSRIYPHWHQIGAATGRSSCSDPNLQGTPKTQEIRSCFLPQSGYRFVIGDLSQIELRVAAEISGDTRLIQAFQDGMDLHRLTASLVTGKPLEDISKDERQAAKAINFGLTFGMGEAGLRSYARTQYGVEMSAREAREFHRRFFRGYPGLAKWIRNQVSDGLNETWTLGGRRRRWGKGKISGTELINSPIQGSVADIIKKALALLPGKLKGMNAKIVACIHDEIIVEVQVESAEKVVAILKETMESAGSYYLHEIPVLAEVRTSTSWGE